MAATRGADTRLHPFVARAHARWAHQPPPGGFVTVDGSLLLLDISGFTALSERLQGQGRAGAEILTDLINEVFTAVLATSPMLGGDVLKFGGDAALVLFRGRGHETRAVRLAQDVQWALRAFARVRTEGGVASISGSVGVASGDVTAHLVGTTHRELVITGAATREVVRLEAAAGAGSVLVAQSTAAALSAPVVDADGVLDLESLVPVLPSTGSAGHMPSEGVRRALPTAILGRHDTLTGASDAEHRRAPIGFIKAAYAPELVGPAAAAERHAAIERLVIAAQQACARHEVTFLSTDVDDDALKIIAIAGVPDAVDRPDERLALALTEIVAADTPELRVRAGAHRGPLFAAEVGAPHRRGFTVMGDTVNLAARVMAQARAGTLLATPAVAERLPAAFGRTPVEPFAAKGKSEPVHASVIEPPEATEVAATAGRTTLVGRDGELKAIASVLQTAAGGHTAALAVVGPAGIGKSRLLAEATSGHDRVELRLEGGLYGRHTPYLAVRRPLRALLGLSRDAPDAQELERYMADEHPDLVPWTPLVAAPLGVLMDDTPTTAALRPEFRRARLHAVTVEVLRHRLTARGPGALVFVDDAQWLDEATRELLAALVTAAADDGLAVIEGIRAPADAPVTPIHPDAEVRRLDALGEEAATAIVDGLLQDKGVAVDRTVRARLVDAGIGNPLFLEELVRAVRRDGTLEETPETVEELIGGRVDRLPAADRRFVREAAVLGIRVEPPLLADLLATPLPLVRATIRRLDDVFDVEGPGVARFRHALLREVAYDGLPYARRRALHARAGRLLLGRTAEPETVAQLLSVHFHEAREHAASWRWSRVAGKASLDAAAPLDAVVFLERAVAAGRILRGLPRREVSELFEVLGDAYERSGSYDAAAKAYARARSFASEAALTRARLCLKAGILHERTGRYSSGLAWFTRGHRALTESDVDESPTAVASRAKLGRWSGALLLRLGRQREALGRLTAAEHDARAVGDRAELANISYLLAWACSELGDPAFSTYRDAARPIYEELGDDYGLANALNNLGADAYDAGDWAEARRCYEESALARERAGDLVHLATNHYNLAELLTNQGHVAEAQRRLERAETIWRPSGYAVGLGLSDLVRGVGAMHVGDLDLAQEALDRAADTLGEIGAASLLFEVRVAQVELHVRRGRSDLAEAMLPGLAEDAGNGGPFEQTREARARALVLSGTAAADAAVEAVTSAADAGLAYEELQALSVAIEVAPGAPEVQSRRARRDALRQRLGIVRPL